MPKGEGTYGSQVGRPPQQKKSLLRKPYAEGDEVDEKEFEPWEFWDYATSLFAPRKTLGATLHKIKERRKDNPAVQARIAKRQKATAVRKAKRDASILGQSRKSKSKLRTQKQKTKELGKTEKAALIETGDTKAGRQAKRARGKEARKTARTTRQGIRADRRAERAIRRKKRKEKRKGKRKKTNVGGRINKQMGELVEGMNPTVRKAYNKTIETKAKYFTKYPEAMDKFFEKDINTIAKNIGFSTERVQEDIEDRMLELILAKREEQEIANPLGARTGRMTKQEGGVTEDQMEDLMPTHTMPDGTVMPGATHEEYEEQMLPDEEMEEDYVDFVLSSTLDQEDKNYLESALAEDAKLSEIFDQVVESASEFSGSGPVEGLGSGVSDSIPARLSDGEFVFTAKATDEIGADNLQRMMEDAEAGADERQNVVHGGVIDEEERAVPIQTRGSVAAQGNVPNVVKQSRQVEEEMLKSSPRRYYVPVSG